MLLLVLGDELPPRDYTKEVITSPITISSPPRISGAVTIEPSNVADRTMVPTGWKVKNTVVTVGGRCLPPQLIALNEYIVANMATYHIASQGNNLLSNV